MQTTDFLLSILILLVTALGRIYYVQLDTFAKEMKELMRSDVEQDKDIEQLKWDRDDHRGRIVKLEHKSNP